MMDSLKKIYCTGCNTEVNARLTEGSEIYPHRPDLGNLPFWKCDACGSYVGCHYKTNNHTKPLGYLSTKEIRAARVELHKVIDPIWKSKALRRGQVYRWISHELGIERFHTANIKNLDEARKAYRAALKIKERLSVCYRCGKPVEIGSVSAEEVGEAHAKRWPDIGFGFQVAHTDCAVKYRKTNVHFLYSPMEAA